MSEKNVIYLNVPLDRVGVLIGKKGEVKSMIERLTSTRIEVDSSTGAVKILFDNMLNGMKAREIVRAIALGFNPQKALKLLSDEYMLEVIDLSEYLPDKEEEYRRVKGRIIGRKGKAWKKIEEYTDTMLEVYRKTVAIIGKYENVKSAKKAVLMLIHGASHPTVFRFLKKEQARLMALERGYYHEFGQEV